MLRGCRGECHAIVLCVVCYVARVLAVVDGLCLNGTRIERGGARGGIKDWVEANKYEALT